MPDDNETFTLITMDDMAVVFSVTDDFAIHREVGERRTGAGGPGRGQHNRPRDCRNHPAR